MAHGWCITFFIKYTLPRGKWVRSAAQCTHTHPDTLIMYVRNNYKARMGATLSRNLKCLHLIKPHSVKWPLFLYPITYNYIHLTDNFFYADKEKYPGDAIWSATRNKSFSVKVCTYSTKCRNSVIQCRSAER